MNYSTQIDTVAIQIDCNTTQEQRELLKSLLGFTIATGLFIDSKDQILGINTIKREYLIYSNNTILATINTGAFRTGSYKNSYEMKYYINIKFAGLKSYNEILDQASNSYLMTTCAFLNTFDIAFKLTELDVCIDIESPFDNLLAICTKKSPKTNYYSFEDSQAYDTTTYIEKISKKKLKTAVLRAYLYDKSHKENLDYSITRFELKLQPKYFNKYGFSINSIKKALDRYYVMYFEDLEEKHSTMEAYNNYNSIRKREIKRLGLDNYRITANMEYIENFLTNLQNINYKHLLVN